MARNQIQFPKELSLTGFFNVCGTEKNCHIFAATTRQNSKLFLSVFLVTRSNEGISALNLPRLFDTTLNTSGTSDNKIFPLVNTVIGNVKKAIHNTRHTASLRHLPRYLADFILF